ncbi:MAG TPA: hypothetical protein VGA61_18320 [Anaerolineae bacterium]
MSTLHRTLSLTLALIMLATLVGACRGPAPAAAPATPGRGGGENTPAATQPTSVALHPATTAPTTGQTGRLLPDPAVGLAGLKNYHATFRQDATGSLAGKPFESHTTLELTRAGSQLDFTRRLQGTDQPAAYFRLLRLDGAVYRWQAADQACQGASGAEAKGEIREPASLLLPVVQAGAPTSETINQVPSLHYHFDERGLPLADPRPAVSGDVWIAQEGGYVVRFVLNAAAPAQPDRQGAMAAQSWSYDLSPAGETGQIALPDDCAAVPADIPTVADAQEVARVNGLLTYTTASKAGDVLDFYFRALPAKGWSTGQKKSAGAVKLPVSLSFTKGDQELSLYLDSRAGGGLDVIVMIYRPGKPAAAGQGAAATSTGAAPRPGPSPTAAPVTGGLPAAVPPYPGATALVTMGAAMKFAVPDPPKVAAGWYHDHMPANGWTLLTEQNPNGTFMQVWQKGTRVVSLVISDAGGVTNVALAQPGH